MLTSLNVRNFTLVDHLEVEFSPGMTAITGETGAGKSLLIEALGMALGDRADTDRIRHNTDKAEISASFDLSTVPDARQWLTDNDFDAGAEGECLLRRLYNREGRSRGYINGQPATMQQLQQLGELLIDLHSQHEHQSLLRRDTHRQLLDHYAGSGELASEVASRYRQWRELAQRLEKLTGQVDQLAAHRDLIAYQVDELTQLALGENEVTDLENEQRLLANAETILQGSQQLMALCRDDEQFNISAGLNRSIQLLASMPGKPAAFDEVEQLLDSARIQVEEAVREIEGQVDRFDINPRRLQEVEERLSAIYQLARKHRAHPDELNGVFHRLSAELSELDSGEGNIEEIKHRLKSLEEDYRSVAGQLSKKRRSAALRFSREVNHQLAELALTSANLCVELTPRQEGSSPQGLEEVVFLVSTNPGHPAMPLMKIASGGELSRISLAIRVVAARSSPIPTLVFDEVDVGIGGATAEVVGRLLCGLGEKGQVLCVTHQAQVAAQADHQFSVRKRSKGDSTQTELVALDQKMREEEIARMLGGISITDQTRSHAREILRVSD